MPSDQTEAMIAAMAPLARRELEAGLRTALLKSATAAERRLADLGALAQMLSMLPPNPGWTYATIKRAEYDERRRPGAPTSAWLTERYSSWKRACRAAYGLKPDGRKLGSGHAWPHEPRRGQPRVPAYTFDEVIGAIRRCGLELACRPTSTTYMHWSSTKRRLARERGMNVRIPNIYAVYRHFPEPAGGRKVERRRQRWQPAVAAAGLTDEELQRAFARRMRLKEVELTVADELNQATVEALRDAGLAEHSIDLMQRGEPGALPLSQAVLAARALGCSLSYLTRASQERGRPPDEGIRFDRIAYMRRRKETGLQAERVRVALKLSYRNARRLALGTFEPSLEQITSLEQMLSLPPAGLLRLSRRRSMGDVRR